MTRPGESQNSKRGCEPQTPTTPLSPEECKKADPCTRGQHGTTAGQDIKPPTNRPSIYEREATKTPQIRGQNDVVIQSHLDRREKQKRPMITHTSTRRSLAETREAPGTRERTNKHLASQWQRREGGRGTEAGQASPTSGPGAAPRPTPRTRGGGGGTGRGPRGPTTARHRRQGGGTHTQTKTQLPGPRRPREEAEDGRRRPHPGPRGETPARRPRTTGEQEGPPRAPTHHTRPGHPPRRTNHQLPAPIFIKKGGLNAK